MLGPAGEVTAAGALVREDRRHRQARRCDEREPQSHRGPRRAGRLPRLLIVGALTGGPKAISDLLVPLPVDWNVATIIVQHVDVAFSQGLAKWLGDRTGRSVRVAEHGHHPQAGDILLAGTNDHLVLAKGKTLEYRDEPPTRSSGRAWMCSSGASPSTGRSRVWPCC